MIPPLNVSLKYPPPPRQCLPTHIHLSTFECSAFNGPIRHNRRHTFKRGPIRPKGLTNLKGYGESFASARSQTELSQSFWPALGGVHAHARAKPSTRLGKELGILESAQSWRADSRQDCVSFASARAQTEIVAKLRPTFGGAHAHAHAQAVRIQTGERTWYFRMA